MSELTMRGHFRYLSFKTFPTTPRTPQCQVFCPLLSSSEHSGVPKDSNSSLFSKCWASPPHLAKVGLRHIVFFFFCFYDVQRIKIYTRAKEKNEVRNATLKLWACQCIIRVAWWGRKVHLGLTAQAFGFFVHFSTIHQNKARFDPKTFK
jgi:hypothetical protein